MSNVFPSYIKLTSWLLGTYRKTIDLLLSLFIGDDLFTLSQLGLCKDYLSLQVQITVSSPLFTALTHTVMIAEELKHHDINVLNSKMLVEGSDKVVNHSLTLQRIWIKVNRKLKK